MNALALACGTPWLIEEESLRLILEIAARENPDPAAIEARTGEKLDYTYKATARDGVAILPFRGPHFRHANLMTRYSGATSLGLLAQDLNAALANPDVKAVLLAIDSPGGEVTGTQEFAGMVRSAEKPVVAYVEGTAASGAYWIATAARRVVMDPTARVGSIGAVTVHRDTRGAQERLGVKDIEVVSSQSPLKRADPTTAAGRRERQRLVDDLAAIFIDRVAEHRRTTPARVAADFGRGGMLVGERAIRVGMADSLGTFESTLADLAAGRLPTSRAGGGPRRQPPTPEAPRGPSVLVGANLAGLGGGDRLRGLADRVRGRRRA